MLGRYGMRAQNPIILPSQARHRRLVQDHGSVRIQGLFLLLIFCYESTLFSVSVISYG
jgi:hypothetical protein